MEFLDKISYNTNLGKLCEEYGISRVTAYKWIHAYSGEFRNGLCVACKKNLFFFLQSKLCIPCRRIEENRNNPPMSSELKEKLNEYARMDLLFSQGKFSKNLEINMEAIEIWKLYEKGLKTKEIMNIFDCNYTWIARRLGTLGLGIKDFTKEKRGRPSIKKKVDKITQLEMRLIGLQKEISNLKKQKERPPWETKDTLPIGKPIKRKRPLKRKKT